MCAMTKAHVHTAVAFLAMTFLPTEVAVNRPDPEVSRRDSWRVGHQGTSISAGFSATTWVELDVWHERSIRSTRIQAGGWPGMYAACVNWTVTGADSVRIPPRDAVNAVAFQLSVVFAVLPIGVALLRVFWDSGVTLTERVQPALCSAMVAAAWASVLPDHNTMRSWNRISAPWATPGKTLDRERALDPVNLGYIWRSTSLLIYMACVVGGWLFMEIPGWAPGWNMCIGMHGADQRRACERTRLLRMRWRTANGVI